MDRNLPTGFSGKTFVFQQIISHKVIVGGGFPSRWLLDHYHLLWETVNHSLCFIFFFFFHWKEILERYINSIYNINISNTLKAHRCFPEMFCSTLLRVLGFQ